MSRTVTLALGDRITRRSQAAGWVDGSSLTLTYDMVNTYRARAASGPFRAAGDYATNSGDEWLTVVSQKDTFIASPSTYRWAGPADAGDGTVRMASNVADDPSYNNNWRYILSAALFSLVADDAAVRSAVAAELVAQSQVTNLDFSNLTFWDDNNGTDVNPSFETATFMAAMVCVYDWVLAGDENALTAPQRSGLLDWFYFASDWFVRELQTAYAKRFTGLDMTLVPPWTGHSGTVGTLDLAYDAVGSTIGATARYFNNRRMCMARYVGMAGQLLTSEGHVAPTPNRGAVISEMVARAKNNVKGWLVYSAYPEGYIGEFERITANGGLYYAWQTVGPALSLAHVLAVNGDTDLWTWSTQSGDHGTASPGVDKSLEWVVGELAKHTEQVEYTRFKSSVLLGMSAQDSATEYGHDVAASMIGYPHYSTASKETIRNRAERDEVGMSGWFASMNGFGSRAWWVGEWGVWPAVNFMFNGVSL